VIKLPKKCFLRSNLIDYGSLHFNSLGEFDFFANFPAQGIPAVVHLFASLQLAVDTTAASYLATTCNTAEISRIQVVHNDISFRSEVP